MRSLLMSSVLAVGFACTTAPLPALERADTTVVTGPERQLIAVGARSEALAALSQRLERVEQRLAAASHPDVIGELSPVDRERVEILARAASGARTDLNHLAGAADEGGAWRGSAGTLAKRVDAILRGLERLPASRASGA